MAMFVFKILSDEQLSVNNTYLAYALCFAVQLECLIVSISSVGDDAVVLIKYFQKSFSGKFIGF